MDQKTKNFDRSIEQMMNEGAVDPPFGMWNRISAELNAEVLPPVSSAPASVVPGRGLVALFGGAMLIGATLVSAYLFNSNTDKATPSPVQQQVSLTTAPIIEKTQPSAAVIEEPKQLTSSIVRKVTIAKPVVEARVEESQPLSKISEPVAEVAIPTQNLAQNASATADPYYFPPVDISLPEAKPVTALAEEVKAEAEIEAEAKPVEKKVRTSSSYSEKRVKPKKKRNSGFTYGRLNRLKNPR